MLSNNLIFFEKAFDILNKRFFESALSKTVITIQSSPHSYGHFTPWQSWQKGNNGFYEINLSAETLNRPLIESLATLTHEMTHQYCCENDIKDVSRGGTYHNKKFKIEAEKRGLIISYHERFGWSVTKPNNEFIEFCNKRWKKEIDIHRKGVVPAPNLKKSSTRKYVCPGCGQSVRATKTLNIICGDCSCKFELVETKSNHQNIGVAASKN